MGGLAGHSDLPPPPPGMTTHERLTQLLETEIQHGHLLQARTPAPPPARRVPAARLLSHRLPPPHPHTHTASTRAPAHPRTPRTSKPAASRWSAHCARSCAGWARCRVRDAAPYAARGRRPLLASGRTRGDLARRSRMYSMSSQLSTAAPLRPCSMVGRPCTSEPHTARGDTLFVA